MVTMARRGLFMNGVALSSFLSCIPLSVRRHLFISQSHRFEDTDLDSNFAGICDHTDEMFSSSIIPATLSAVYICLAAMVSTTFASVQDSSISPRPPMGFNNWARFQCNLNETLFTRTADAMAANGLLAAGYNHINLDDCWHVQTGRNSDQELEWNSTLFPHGMPWLGDYFHDRGFSFGIYTNAGNRYVKLQGATPRCKTHAIFDSFRYRLCTLNPT